MRIDAHWVATGSGHYQVLARLGYQPSKQETRNDIPWVLMSKTIYGETEGSEIRRDPLTNTL